MRVKSRAVLAVVAVIASVVITVGGAPAASAQSDNDTIRVSEVARVVSALESYAAVNKTYLLAGTGSNGTALGWLHLASGSAYPKAISAGLAEGGHLNANDLPHDPTHPDPGIYDTSDFLVYRCKDRVGVFSLSDGIQTAATDKQWWDSNGCTQYPIEQFNHSYMGLTSPLVDVAGLQDDARMVAIDGLVTALERFAAANGTYRLTGAGSRGKGVGWLHYDNGGAYPKSIAAGLVEGGYLDAGSVPKDPAHPDTSLFSKSDFLIYTCADRTGIFSLSDGVQTDPADEAWWDANGCTNYALENFDHQYMRLTAPLGSLDLARVAASDRVVAALESYGATTGTYVVAGSGFRGNSQGWLHYADGRSNSYPQSIADGLVVAGHLDADDMPRDPTHADLSQLNRNDFLVYQCKDRVGVFSVVSDSTKTAVADKDWWDANGCTQYAIETFGHLYMALTKPLSVAAAPTCAGQTFTLLASDVARYDFPDIEALAATYAAELAATNQPAALVDTYVADLQVAKVQFDQARSEGYAGPIVLGTPGNDVIVGTSRTEWILGLGGDDRICGRAGDDFLSGGGGQDHIDGERGRDSLSGGSRAQGENLDGGAGYDVLLVHLEENAPVQTATFGQGGGEWMPSPYGPDGGPVEAPGCIWWA